MSLYEGAIHDRGGTDTPLQFFRRGSNMHRVWDSGIIDQTGRGEDGWLDDLVAMDADEAVGKRRPAP